MTDDLRDALSAAYDKVEENVPDAAEADAGDGVEQEAPESTDTAEAAQRARDEQGRFAKSDEAAAADGKDKPREKLTLKKGAKDAAKEQERAQPNGQGNANVVEVAAQPAAAVAEPGPAGKPGEPILPPQHWNGRGKIEFERLPYHVKQTLVDEYNSVAELRTLAPVLEPVKQTLMQEFGGVDRGLGAILSTWHHARTQPLDFANQFLQRYGIDPQTLTGVASGVQPQGDDAPQYVTRQDLAAIQARERQEAQAAAAAQQIHTDISTFGTSTNTDGSLVYPYFNDVRQKMAGLMSVGAAAGLKEAYEMAVYADPQIRATLFAADQAKQAAERRKQADQARGAAVQVTGAPGHRGPGKALTETADQTLSRIYDQLQSGGRA